MKVLWNFHLVTFTFISFYHLDVVHFQYFLTFLRIYMYEEQKYKTQAKIIECLN